MTRPCFWGPTQLLELKSALTLFTVQKNVIGNDRALRGQKYLKL